MTAAAQACRMGVRIELPDWNSLARLDDGALPLLGTALLIARDEYPDLDADLYDTPVQGHAAGMREEIDALEHWALKMQAINRRSEENTSELQSLMRSSYAD